MSPARQKAANDERCCVGCRQRQTRPGLVRFVAQHGKLCVDVSQSLPGRGAWAHPKQGCVARALKKGGFARTLHQAIDDDATRVLTEAAAVIRREALHLLGLLRRSGSLWYGRDESQRAVADSNASALWLASDAADRTARAIETMAQSKGLPVHIVGNRDHMGAALGSAPVAVVALPAGKAGDRAIRAVALWTALEREAKVYNA